VTVIELTDAPCVPDTALETPRKTEYCRVQTAGRCDFCHAPLPAFTRLRTRRGWGFG
jgi:hypothetical protein